MSSYHLHPTWTNPFEPLSDSEALATYVVLEGVKGKLDSSHRWIHFQ